MNNNNPHLGVNKLGRNIRKSPLHQPNFPSGARPPPPQQHQQQPPPPQPQPLVYNISKNEFRSIVQQLTGTPSRCEPSPSPPPPYPRPPTAAAGNYKQPPSNRLQRIRPPPLAPIARPPPPLPNPAQNLRLHSPLFPPFPAPNPLWAPTAESPVSAYMRYLENSIVNQPSHWAQPPQLPQQGILPTPLPNPAPLTPQGLPSPLPSPSAFLNLLSPRSPHPLISPNFQFLPQLSPGLLGSPFPQVAGSGILGPGPGPQQPPLSPGLFSPSSFLLSPRWRNM